MARFLLAATPFAGHVVPMTGLARALLARGHEVLFHTGSTQEERVTRSGAAFVPWRQAQDFDDARLEEAFPRLRQGNGPRAILGSFREVFFGTAVGQARDLVDLYRHTPFDAMIAENTCYGPILAHDLLGVPFGTASLSLLMQSTDGGPHPGLPFPAGRGLAGRTRDAVARTVLELTVDRLIGRWHNQIRREVGLAATAGPGFHGLLSTRLVLAQGVPALEPPRPRLPEHVHFVGDLAGGARTAQQGRIPDWLNSLEGDHPVVHVSEGTLGRNRHSLVSNTVRALADEAQIVVGGRHSAGDLPADVIAADWVPHDLLFPRVDLFVSNAGYGAVLAALSHGVPVLAVPDAQDKPVVARRVAATGAGRVVSARRAGSERLRTIAREMLADPSYAQRARQIGGQIAGAGGAGRAAELAETLL